MNLILKRLGTLSITPNDTKQENFSLALVDYFAKELKNNGFDIRKNNGYVKIILSNIYEDKYDSVIIDCVNGKMYLRGNGSADKYFGRLSKFNNNRASDAYHCVNYNVTRIMNRVRKLENNVEFNQIEMMDGE